MTHIEIAEKLQLIRPLAQWVLYGNSYESLVWLDLVQTKPTEEEIFAE